MVLGGFGARVGLGKNPLIIIRKLIFRVSEEGKRGKLVNGVAVNSLVFYEASIL